MNKTTPDKKKYHPDYGLSDQAAGRCPYCLASADMDCDCEATPTPDKEKIREEFVKWTKEGKLLKLEKGEYDIRKGYEPEEIADWWLDKMEAQKAEIIAEIEGKIKEIWNYPCNCARKQIECKHNYDTMFSILSILRKER